MRVGAVTCIDHWDVDDFGQIIGRTRGRVAHNNDVCLERFHITRSIAKGLSLGQAASTSCYSDCVCAESAGGHLEGEPCAGAWL